MNYNQYYEMNRERIIEYNKNYYWTHREYKQNYNKEYYIQNKEKIQASRKLPPKQRKRYYKNVNENDKIITVYFH